MQDPIVQLTVFHYDLAIREIKRMEHGRVKIAIVHRYGHTTSDPHLAGRCVTGEEVQSTWIIFQGRSFQLPLGIPHLILWDYLCRHCRGMAQHAAEIEAGLREKSWYVHHASMARRRGIAIARSSRTNIKKQVERIRKEMAELFVREHLPLRAEEILFSQPTSTRQVRYSVRAEVVIEH